MITLTGRLTYITGQHVPPESIGHVTVTAPTPRANGHTITTTHPSRIDPDGTITLTVEPGPATLTALVDHDLILVHLYVRPGMTTIPAAADAALARR